MYCRITIQSAYILIFSICTLHHISAYTKKEMEKLQIYYKTDGSPVPMLPEEKINVPMDDDFPNDKKPLLKSPAIRFGPVPCTCQDLTCGCCVNMRVQLFNFSRNACTNFTYDPYDFAIKMNMLWNEESIYNTSISGKNPPPFCLQAPIPYFPTMDQCVRLFNIFTPGRNIHMCMNLETRFERTPILVLQFDCMRMGADGVALLKPEDEGGLMKPEETSSENPEVTQEAVDEFDPVDSNKKTNQTNIAEMSDKKENNTENLENETIVVNTTSLNINMSMEGNSDITIVIDDNEGNFTSEQNNQTGKANNMP